MPYYNITIKCKDEKTRKEVYEALDRDYEVSKVCAADNTIIISGFTLPRGSYTVELNKREKA